MSLFTGSGVALVTPFYKDNSVNYEMLTVLLKRQIKQHTDAIIICGTTGEPATLSVEERENVIRHTVSIVSHRIPVIVGCGANATSQAVWNAKRAEELGADGILVVTPYYNKATQNGLYEHFCMVANAVSVPVILYNVPSRTGCNLKPQTVEKIVDACKNVVGIKEASSDISQIADLAALLKDKIDIYSGNDDQIIPILSLGGKGVISVLANVLPKETHDMVLQFMQGQQEKALELQLQYLPLVRQLFSEVNPIPVKAALQEIGYDCGGLRLPLTQIEENNRKKLCLELEKLQII